MALHVNSTKYLKKYLVHIFLKVFQKLKNTSKLIFQGQHRSDTKTRQRQYNERVLQASIRDKQDAKMLNKILQTGFNSILKRIIHYD